MKNRFCKKCSTIKPVSEFTLLKRTYKDKTYLCYQSGCKSCMRNKWKEWKENNPEKVREKDRARKRCIEEWNPTRTPIPFHTLRRKNAITKYTRTDTAVTKSKIILCPCGNRYLKTRQGQTHCLRCIAYGGDNRQLASRAMV
jgi:hypothetical protein